MPFTAKYRDTRVDATVLPVDLSNELKTSTERHDLMCPDPDCDVQMIPKTYRRTGTQFFAHKTESQCPMSNAMTQEHLSLQKLVRNAAADTGWKAQMEVYLPELRHEQKRYVDVLAISPDDPDCRIAFEIQWSYQTPEAYIERTQSYAERGIRTYWISKRKTGSMCFQYGVCNFILTDDCDNVSFDSDSLSKNTLRMLVSRSDDIKPILIPDFVKRVLVSNGIFTVDCVFNSNFHFCKGVDCAIAEGEFEDDLRAVKIDETMDALIKYIRPWCPYKKLTSDRLWLILNRIAKNEKLPDVRHTLEEWYDKGFHYVEGNENLFFEKIYAPPNLPKLCRWLWNSEELYQKLMRTPAYDPRLDYQFWLCDCDWKHLEVGYRLFPAPKNSNKPTRVSVIRCAKCGAMNSGAGPHKKRVKPHLLRDAKRYEASGNRYPPNLKGTLEKPVNNTKGLNNAI